MQSFLLVGAGGALGAMGRHGVSILAGRMWGTAFPVGTLLINIVGSLAMGVLVGVLARAVPAWQEPARLFVAIGMLGGFTTFSAFSLDAIGLVERGEHALAGVYVIASVLGAVLGLYVGLLLTRGPT